MLLAQLLVSIQDPALKAAETRTDLEDIFAYEDSAGFAIQESLAREFEGVARESASARLAGEAAGPEERIASGNFGVVVGHLIELEVAHAAELVVVGQMQLGQKPDASDEFRLAAAVNGGAVLAAASRLVACSGGAAPGAGQEQALLAAMLASEEATASD